MTIACEAASPGLPHVVRFLLLQCSCDVDAESSIAEVFLVVVDDVVFTLSHGSRQLPQLERKPDPQAARPPGPEASDTGSIT
jgi:hypothetical protein